PARQDRPGPPGRRRGPGPGAVPAGVRPHRQGGPDVARGGRPAEKIVAPAGGRGTRTPLLRERHPWSEPSRRSRAVIMARPLRLTGERLEARRTPAVFGPPWTDPLHLTLSFAPDGTQIAGHASTLFQTLNVQEPTADWQRAILRAVQTWVVNANISVGV